MIRRSTLFSILLAAGLFASAPAHASAQGDRPAPPDSTQDGVRQRGERTTRGDGKGRRRAARRHRMGLRGLRRQLDLTDAQREQLRALRQNVRGTNEDERAELRELRRLRRQGGTLTPEQQARGQALREQLHAAGEARRQEFLSVLTPEQRAQLERQRNEMRERREERRKRREEFRQRRTEQTPQP